jgi:hypothetical protein
LLLAVSSAGINRISFDWTAIHHFAAVDHARRHFKRTRLSSIMTLLVPLLAGLAIFGLYAADPSLSIGQLLWSVVPVVTLGAAFWAVFMSRAGRRLVFGRTSPIPIALEFDTHGVTVALGKAPLSYPWAKVRSIDEDAEYVFVLASCGVCYAIPKSAFGNPLAAEHFATTMRRLLGR